MSKKRIVLGNFCKAKDGDSRYLKLNVYEKGKKDQTTITLRNGEYLNFESLDTKLQNARKAAEEGKITEQVFEQISERVEKDRSYGALAEVYITREE